VNGENSRSKTNSSLFSSWSFRSFIFWYSKKELRGLSPLANYTDRATPACRRSYCQLLRIESATWSAWRIPTAVFSLF
jgi:hypothetical protein